MTSTKYRRWTKVFVTFENSIVNVFLCLQKISAFPGQHILMLLVAFESEINKMNK